MLLPLWRTHSTYHELALSHENFEAVHNQFRELFHVAPNSYTIRPKRRGIACQQLRATVSVLVMWMIVAEMFGWAPTMPPGVRRRPVRKFRHDERRKDRVWATHLRRRAAGLCGGHAKRRRE